MILHADFGATEDHPIVDSKVRKILDSTNEQNPTWHRSAGLTTAMEKLAH